MTIAMIHPDQIVRDGKSAYLVPSRSHPELPHYVRLNPASCDCKGFQYRGQCAHVVAVVAMYEEREL
jgi:hypothetical protein